MSTKRLPEAIVTNVNVSFKRKFEVTANVDWAFGYPPERKVIRLKMPDTLQWPDNDVHAAELFTRQFERLMQHNASRVIQEKLDA